jgi:mono/diheme cytochrome c family protein
MRAVLSFCGAVAWLATALLAGCGAKQPGDPAGEQMQVDSARSPAVSTRAQISGRKVFLRENCYGCHGIRGGGGMCPNLRGREVDVSVVQDGTPTGMPNFTGRVTDQEMNDLEAYLASLGTANEPTFTHWWEAVPSQ